jgi:hypothetical protein
MEGSKMAKTSAAQIKAAQKWQAANVDRLSLVVPKGQRDEIKTAAAAAGESVNAYIIAAIRARMGNADGGAAPAAEIIQAAQPGQAAGADALTLPADVARLASHAAKLAGTAPATWARQALESAAAAEADAFERKQAALSAFKKFKPEQTAPGNSGDLPPEQAGSKTPGD